MLYGIKGQVCKENITKPIILLCKIILVCLAIIALHLNILFCSDNLGFLYIKICSFFILIISLILLFLINAEIYRNKKQWFILINNTLGDFLIVGSLIAMVLLPYIKSRIIPNNESELRMVIRICIHLFSFYLSGIILVNCINTLKMLKMNTIALILLMTNAYSIYRSTSSVNLYFWISTIISSVLYVWTVIVFYMRYKENRVSVGSVVISLFNKKKPR